MISDFKFNINLDQNYYGLAVRQCFGGSLLDLILTVKYYASESELDLLDVLR